MHTRLTIKTTLAAAILALAGSRGETAETGAPVCAPPPAAAFAFDPFLRIDANADGELSKAEAMSFHESAFDMRDTNRDGKITIGEAAARFAPFRQPREFE
ncbi:MAG: hypothetical protein NW215_04490 [Hyphomicrobiales bacterium]|nr:hypothetical protein [Hyphomicrobiales bacterium]